MKTWHAIVLVGVCVSVAVALNVLSMPRTPAKVQPSAEELVTVRADFSQTGCPRGAVPLGVKNGSDRTLKQVAIRAAAYQDGRSDNLLKYEDQRVTWTKIVEPGEEIFECAVFEELLPHSPTARVIFRFEREPDSALFYAPGEFVPRIKASAEPSSKSKPSAVPPSKTKAPGGK